MASLLKVCLRANWFQFGRFDLVRLRFGIDFGDSSINRLIGNDWQAKQNNCNLASILLPALKSNRLFR